MNAENAPDGRNLVVEVVEGFGDEWERYDQSWLSGAELQHAFEGYFGIFPWNALPSEAQGFDMGCGSGRWAKLVAPRVGKLFCIDPSPRALAVARQNLTANDNCEFICASVDDCPIPDSSQDFGYCLGVLHHVPDTMSGLKACVAKLKPGAPFLVYLYYAFDNRPWWFKLIWRGADLVRRLVSRMPYGARSAAAQCLAVLIYWPLARTAKILESVGFRVDNFPLSYYRYRSFNTLLTDALDRFGTRLEKRFSRDQIAALMSQSGLERVVFSESAPFWCALGYRR